MELKKSPQADLQNKRLLFFEMGLTVSLLSLIIAFSYNRDRPETMIDFLPPEQIITEEIIPITRQERRVQPPQRQQVRIVSQILQIVTDETQIMTEINFEEFSEEPVSVEFSEGSGVSEQVDFGNEIYIKVEEEPKFMGRSWESFHYWVLRQVKYPKAAIKNNIQGIVVVRFVVEKNGTVSNVEAISTPNPLLTEEALRVVNLSSTHWTPGKQRNTPVRSRLEIPIEFNLGE